MIPKKNAFRATVVIVLILILMLAIVGCGKEKHFDPAPEKGNEQTVLPPSSSMVDIEMPAATDKIDTTESPVEATPVVTEEPVGSDDGTESVQKETTGTEDNDTE